jgi:hypothetical protein
MQGQALGSQAPRNATGLQAGTAKGHKARHEAEARRSRDGKRPSQKSSLQGEMKRARSMIDVGV